jgi:hypothetical protein
MTDKELKRFRMLVLKGGHGPDARKLALEIAKDKDLLGRLFAGARRDLELQSRSTPKKIAKLKQALLKNIETTIPTIMEVADMCDPDAPVCEDFGGRDGQGGLTDWGSLGLLVALVLIELI